MSSSSGSSSGLTFKLHPLVIVNISDYYTRVKSQSNASSAPLTINNSGGPPPRCVFGCVIGIQTGRTVEIFNSFELLFEPTTDSLDSAFLLKKLELWVKMAGKSNRGKNRGRASKDNSKVVADANGVQQSNWVISHPEWTSQPLPSQRWWIRCKQPQATNPNRRKPAYVSNVQTELIVVQIDKHDLVSEESSHSHTNGSSSR
ncbi:COP9 signalosome complex subunit 6a [Cinnamomum micranthum f. kanehirae]|uniref:COP9 signalosome complex subunit 6a n=1 Tax=Cinnamomum micranthum f. kanehirae TaxID=337451 RepID=A0A443NNE6_9MAGN|nr:COP9 signalosome complex subunit 6a [Cinnamomum micranthum f. kanehirae]